MRWIKEHKLISVLIAILVASLIMLGISVSVRKSDSGGGNFVNRIYVAIEKPMVSFGRSISENVKGMFSYRELMAENKALKEENEKLQKEVTQHALSASELVDMQELAKALNYDFINGSEDIVTADVVSMDGNRWTNVFSIDRGTESGIKKGSIVICGEGLVGRVIETGKNWSKVTSVIDESSNISFKVDGNLNLLGVVEGAKDGRLTGYMLDNGASVSKGDMLVTSGMGMFPAGIRIGRITKVSMDSDRQLKKIEVKPAVDFNSMDKVSVII